MKQVLSGLLLAVVASTANAQTSDQRALKMAECGFLTMSAVQEMRALPEKPDFYQDFVVSVVDFTNLYYAYSQRDRLVEGNRINDEMLNAMAAVGQEAVRKRTLAMSRENAVKLSNRLLRDCAADLKDILARIDAAKASRSPG